MAALEDVESTGSAVTPDIIDSPAPILVRRDIPQIRYISDYAGFLGQYLNEVMHAVVQDRDRVQRERDQNGEAYSGLWDMYTDLLIQHAQLLEWVVVLQSQIQMLNSVVNYMRLEINLRADAMFGLCRFHERMWIMRGQGIVQPDVDQMVRLGRLVAGHGLGLHPGYAVLPSGEVIRIGDPVDHEVHAGDAEHEQNGVMEENPEGNPEEDPEEEPVEWINAQAPRTKVILIDDPSDVDV